ncbi:uncharacterized protein [Palaemon carinicauda]|uniref:uncharacterized protein n=1 Tax=Palaemon carinicauda TaxID=392227 RepID=UPI0035B69DC9
MRGTHQLPKRETGELSQQVRRVFRCWQCGGERHQWVNCPIQRSLRCYTCQAYGHLSRDCPAKNAEGGRAVVHAHHPPPNVREKGNKERGGQGRSMAPCMTTDAVEQAVVPLLVPLTAPPQH